MEPAESARTTQATSGASGSDRRNSRGQRARQRILITAERLFAANGIDAVPLRDIAEAAGQRNNAAVHYYFGDREGLVRSIAAYRASDVEASAASFFADLASGARPPQVSENVRLFVHSLARNIEQDNYYLPFLARYIVDRRDILGLGGIPERTAAMLHLTLTRLVPHCPEEVLSERWRIFMTGTVHALARYQIDVNRGLLVVHPQLDDLLDDMIECGSAGLNAPWPPSRSDGRGK